MDHLKIFITIVILGVFNDNVSSDSKEIPRLNHVLLTRLQKRFFINRNNLSRTKRTSGNSAVINTTNEFDTSSNKGFDENENATIVPGLTQRGTRAANTSSFRGELKFLDVPPGGGMRTPQLQIDNGYYVFNFITDTMRFLHPTDYPYDFLKNLMWDRITSTQLVLQVIDVEAGYLGSIFVLLILSLALPSGIFIQVFCGRTSPNDDDHRVRRLATITALDVLLILLPAGIVGMFAGSELFARAVDKSPAAFKAALDDLDVFVRNTQLQVRFVATTSIDKAVDATVANLEHVEDLLGKPVQRELATETGLDVALDALSDITVASESVSTQIITLRAEAQAAREAARITQERLNELKRQVEATKKQCTDNDKNLCEDVDTTVLTVAFKTDKMISDRRLSKLKQIGEGNLTKAVTEARLEYEGIPQKIIRDTEASREGIKNVVESQRAIVYERVRSLEEISEYFTSSVQSLTPRAEYILEEISNVEQWRRPIALTTATFLLLIWILMTTAVICAGCGCESKVSTTLHTAVGLIATCSMGLWAVSTITILTGGNADLFTCHPLDDDPNYMTLSLILDHPGLLYKDSGLFSSILKGNHSMDVPIKHILRECRLNRPAFPTFGLSRIFNVDAITNHAAWPGLSSHLANITVDLQNVEIAKISLQKTLQDLSQAAGINLTTYVTQLKNPTMETDLGIFADRLEKTAGRMTDVTTSARMETLSSRARKILINNINKFEKRKEDMIDRLTTLEHQLLPLQKQANQSLSHLRTIQYYIMNQGSNISEKKTNLYVARLVRLLEKFREHVLNELTYEVAPCKPIWDVFQLGKKLICGNMVEPTVAFSVSTMWCLFVFIIMTPLSLLLASDYTSLSNASMRRDLGELLLGEQTGWTSTQSTPESVATPEQSVWTTPRRPSEQLLVPYRLSPEQRSVSPRRGVERGVSPGTQQRESLRMIERVMPWARVLRTAGVPSPSRG